MKLNKSMAPPCPAGAGESRNRGAATRFSAGVLRKLAATAFVALTALAGATAARADVNIGYVAYDVTSATTAEFDIVNITGANSGFFGDPAFPVTTAVTLGSLALTVNFTNGTSASYGSSYFTLLSDGLSFDGSPIATGGVNPLVIESAKLTGTFTPTTLAESSGPASVSILSTFTATIDPGATTAAADGDAALIVATAASAPVVPEPGSAGLLASGLMIGCAIRHRRRRPDLNGFQAVPARRRGVAGWRIAAVVCLVVGIAAAPTPSGAVFSATPVTLTTLASPSSGIAGLTFTNLTASSLPAGAVASSLTVTLAPTCAASPVGSVVGAVTTPASKITSLPFVSGKRIQFEIPATTPKGTLYVSINGTTTTGTSYYSSNCSLLTVTTTNKTLNACVPTSSLAVALGTNVTAYVPNGWWGGSNTGVRVVPVEPTGTPVTIPTGAVVNSCSANPATGTTICTANSTAVYLINGTTLTTTLTSGASGSASFSGGSCQNCGVAINALTNTAYIAEGSSSGPSGSAIQVLNLATNTFSAPVNATHEVSEDISVDPTRNLVLSGSEDGNYELFELNSAGQLVLANGDLSLAVNPPGIEWDSAAEDCTTGIALAPGEFTGDVFFADLSQLTTPTTTTWTAPNQVVKYPELVNLAAGASGISVAPGSGHLGVVAGEFGGDLVGVFKLPATSGSGTPTPQFVDYVVFNIPATPDGNAFTNGFDPHTLTAYTSPNDGKAYALMADWPNGSSGVPLWLAKIDLAAALAAPRSGHTLTSVPAGVVTFVKTQ